MRHYLRDHRRIVRHWQQKRWRPFPQRPEGDAAQIWPDFRSAAVPFSSLNRHLGPPPRRTNGIGRDLLLRPADPAEKNSDGIVIKSRRDVPNCVPQPEKTPTNAAPKKKVQPEEAKVERFTREHRNVSMVQSTAELSAGGRGATTEAPLDSK